MFNNLWRRWLRQLSHSRARTRPIARHARCRLALEALEDRIAPANVSGTIPNGTVWTSAQVETVIGNIDVPQGSTLTIDPGTVIQFNGGTNLTVEGTVNASGTSAQHIFFTSYRDSAPLGGANTAGNGDWDKIEFNSTSTSNVLNFVEVRYAGGGDQLGAIVDNGVALSLTNSVVRNTYYASGLRIVTANPTVTGDTFANNNSQAIGMDLSSNPVISGITVTNNGINGLLLDSGSLAVNSAWTNPNIVYQLSGNLTVPQGITLTVGAGQVVKANGPNLIVNGTMTAQGTAAQPIIFTSYRDDSAGGNTENDGTGTNTGGHGDWDKLEFNSGSTGTLNFVQVRYAGGGDQLGGLVDNGGTLSFTNGGVSHTYYAPALRIANASPTVTGDTFANNNSQAIGMDLSSNPVISGITVNNNGINGLLLDKGSLAVNSAWTNPAVVYQLSGDTTVPQGITLTVGAGQAVKANGNSLIVNGTMTAQGTATQPIIFTSYRDDSAGGDTNNDGASSGGHGDWDKLEFNSGSTGTLNFVQVRYAGSGDQLGGLVDIGGALSFTNGSISNTFYAPALRIATANPTITGDTFANNNSQAIGVDLSSNPVISGITVTNNGINGLLLDGGSLTVNGAWTNPAVVYQLSGDTTVPQGITLTVGAGQVIKANGQSLVVNGTMTAQGTAAQPIIFTSYRDDSAGGDTNNDGASSGGNGDWGKIEFNSTSTGDVLNFVQVRYAGGGDKVGAIVDNGGALSFTNGTVSNTYYAPALRMVTANPTLTGDTFANNNIQAIGMDLASHPVITSVTMTKNGLNGLLLDGGSLPGNAFWDNPAIVYELSGDVTVPKGDTLTVAAGQIVKADGQSLLVNGTLTAQGTAAQPIVFTSYRDDAQGGDTNNDGISGGGNGDWDKIEFNSTSTGSVLNDVQIFFAGGGDQLGAIVDNGGALTLTDSVIANTYYAPGLDIKNASPTVTNNVFHDNFSTAILAESGATPQIANNTLVNDYIGISATSNAVVLAVNNIIVSQGNSGVAVSGGGVVNAYDNDVFNVTATAGNYAGMSDQTGHNGNISADPDFNGRGLTGDYRLYRGSPAVDAGLSDSSVVNFTAPATDALGNPRFDDPGVANTGGGAKPFYEIGAFERQNPSLPDADLSLTLNSAPTTVIVGDTAILTWTVTNIGPHTAIAPWTDSVAIIDDVPSALAPTDLLDVAHTTDLGVGQSYIEQVAVPVEDVVPGQYQWVVVTNSHNQVFEATRTANDKATSGPVSVTMNTLTPGQTATGQFTGDPAEAWYQLPATAGQNFHLSLSRTGSSGATELYVAFDVAPSTTDYDLAAGLSGGTSANLDITNADNGTYYVLARAANLGGAAPNFQLLATAFDFQASSVAPSSGGNAGEVTVTIHGLGLPPQATATLTTVSGQTIAATAVHWQDASDLVAAFNLVGATPGAATITVVSGAVQSSLPAAFTVDAGGSANFWLTVTGPQFVHPRLPPVFTVSWGNSGTIDAPVELVNLFHQSTNGTWKFSPGGVDIPAHYVFLAMDPNAATPVIAPGNSETFNVYFTATDVGDFSINADYNAINDPSLAGQPIDWSSILSATPPAGLDAAQYGALASQLETQLGTTYASALPLIAADVLKAMHQPFVPAPVPGAASLDSALVSEVSAADLALGWDTASPVKPARLASNSSPPDSSPPAPGQVKAVIVGVGKYPPGVPNIAGTETDLDTVNQWLLNQVKADPNNITTLSTNGSGPSLSGHPDVTPSNMRTAIQTLATNTGPSDTAFVYYSGHGVPSLGAGNPGAFELDGPNQHDSYDYMTFLNDLSASQGHVVIVVDACYSGSLIDALKSGTFPNDLRGRITIVTAAANDEESVSHLALGGNFTSAYFNDLDGRDVGDVVFGGEPGTVSMGQGFGMLPSSLTYNFVQQGGQHPQYFSGEGNHRGDGKGDINVDTNFPTAVVPVLSGVVTANAPTGKGKTQLFGVSGHSNDPNQLTTTGVGTAGFIAPDGTITYDIYFENVPPAGVNPKYIFPAQQVVVTDPLPANVDLSTFQLDAVGFGSTVVPIAPGQSQFTGSALPTTDSNPVQIQASIDPQTGIITWNLGSIDPTTGMIPVNPVAGFLPVNDATNQGEGFVSFSIRPTAGQADGTQISNTASIVFDTNKPLSTNTAVNTIDATAPTSTVSSLPATSGGSFTVSWSGSAGAAGLDYYDVYVSDNGGAYTLFQSGTTATSAVFAGQDHHTYSFYSIATDNAGVRQATPASAEANTMVVNIPTTIGGTTPSTSITDLHTATPFTNVTLTDPDSGEMYSMAVALSNGVNGTLSNLSGGSYNAATGTYTLANVSLAAAQAAVRSLVFTPTAHQVVPGATVKTTFTITVTDGDLLPSDSSTIVTTTAANTSPSIAGTVANQKVNATGALTPFATATLTDPDFGETYALTVTPGAAANGTLSNLSGGTYNSSTGVFTLSNVSLATAQAALRALTFKPTPVGVPPGASQITGFAVAVNDGFVTTTDSTTSVIAIIVVISPSTLSGGVLATAYNQPLTAVGGTAPYSFVVSSGTLPPGLTLSGAGALTGTPTQADTFAFTVKATDASGAPGPFVASTSYNIHVVTAPLSITTTTLTSDWTAGTAGYSQTVATTGGTPPATFMVSAGTLPAGLALSTTTGVISGTPTTAGSSTFTITATDAGNAAASQAYTVVVIPSEFVYDQIAHTLVITLIPSLANFQYTQTTSVNGGVATSAYTFSLSGTGSPVSQTFTDAQLTSTPGAGASVTVTGQGIIGTAILITNDTYADQNGQKQETPERISLGSLTDAGVGTMSKFIGNSLNNQSYSFMALKNFPLSYAYAGRADGTIMLQGTAGTGKVGFVTAGYYSYIAAAVTGLYAHFGEGTPDVVGTSAGNADDFAYHYTSSSASAVSSIPSVFSVSGITSSYMSGSQTNPEDGGAIDTFNNVAHGFALNTAVSYSGNSVAYINDSALSDTYVGQATDPLGLGSIGGVAGFSYMYEGAYPAFGEFDVAYGFGTYFAAATTGGHDVAYPGAPANDVFSGDWIRAFG